MKKKLLSSLIVISLAITPSSIFADTNIVNNGIINTGPMIIQFSDLKSDNWAYPAVRSMSKRDVINGYKDGTFRPNESISREEFAKMIATTFSLELPVTQDVYFSDVSSSRWSYSYISAAKDYLTGYYPPQGKAFFDPVSDATREDVAAALVKIMDLDTSSYSSHFTDEANISPQLKKYVNVAADHNLITGYSDGTFKPLGPISRAEAAALLYRAIKNVGGISTPISGQQTSNPNVPSDTSVSGNINNGGPRLWMDVVNEDTSAGGNPSILVKGETVPGATVTVNGNEVSVGYSGEFSTNIFVKKDGEYPVEVKASYLGKTTTATKSIKMSVAAPKLILDEPSTVQIKSGTEYNIWFQWSDKYDSKPTLYVNGEQRLYSLGGRRNNGEAYSGVVKVSTRKGENTFNLKLVNRFDMESNSVTKSVYYQ
ncbi:S-layer homology domain-containing protein [Paenibacillus massiliensis]|uniref:S-layer homology domain-containing protein n=1 Tax=Paenibacillus massiliensis TaxID=225917 RepID=UPI00040508CF|nr:S-layer homology domain-containing protein [Paenibacillus massiliensis]